MDRLLDPSEKMNKGDYAIRSPYFIDTFCGGDYNHPKAVMPIAGLAGDEVGDLVRNYEECWWVAVMRPEIVENHYGVWVVSNTPITGVINNNAIAWEWIEEVVCLDCVPDIDEIGEPDWEYIECDSAHTKLIGDWIVSDNDKNKTAWFKDWEGKFYTPNRNGEWAAIERECYTQIVWSQTTTRCHLCSPCYPGQGDLDTKGEFLTYSLPVDLYASIN